MKALPEGWEVKPFAECINKEVSSNKLKIPQSKFLDEGKYAIIDQSVEFIAGYTDDSSKIFKDDLPVVIFGDHTKIFKFIDFPFALGADGTKILVPKKDILNPKYFYFYLKGLRIENHGYSRHYKFLKENQILLPPLPTQKKIAAILEKADQLKEWRKEADRLTDEFLKSTFLEMFGDPGNNPKGWEVKKLGEVCISIKDGPHVSPNYVEEGIPFISVHNIINGFFDLSDLKYISFDDHKQFCKRCKPEKGDVLYSKGGTTGIAKRIDIDFEFSIWVHLALLKFSKEIINPIFFESCLNSNYCKLQAKRYTRGIANRDLVLNQMAKLKIIVPPLIIQEDFAQIVEKIEPMQQIQKQSKQQIENLFNALMQQAFKGELAC